MKNELVAQDDGEGIEKLVHADLPEPIGVSGKPRRQSRSQQGNGTADPSADGAADGTAAVPYAEAAPPSGLALQERARQRNR
jgi:hypothetical protein